MNKIKQKDSLQPRMQQLLHGSPREVTSVQESCAMHMTSLTHNLLSLLFGFHLILYAANPVPKIKFEEERF